MLASLLPGLRELRAPLTAGYVWLLGLWLAASPFLPPAGQATGVYRELTNLATWAGKPAVLAAATLTAYLLGTISIAITHSMDDLVSPILRHVGKLNWIKPGHRGSRRVRRALRDAAVNRLCTRFLEDETFQQAVLDHVSSMQVQAQREGGELPSIMHHVRPEHLRRRATDDYLHRWHLLDAVATLDTYVESAKEDLEYLAPRLLGKEDELYGEYDRLNAEGTFRVGMVLPATFLFAVFAVRLSPWWLTGMAIPLQLAYLGSASWSTAEKNLAVALAADRVESPTLQRLTAVNIEFVPYHELAVASSRTTPPLGLLYPRPRKHRRPQGPVTVKLPGQGKPK